MTPDLPARDGAPPRRDEPDCAAGSPRIETTGMGPSDAPEKPAAPAGPKPSCVRDDPARIQEVERFRSAFPFPVDLNPFIHGFEAECVWRRMNSGETFIDSPIPCHSANAAPFRRMAAIHDYEMTIVCRFDHEWIVVNFEKRKRLKMMKGGKA